MTVSSISGRNPMARQEGDARSALIGRMRKLERLGLAKPMGAARWHLSERAEPTLRALGERNDIIKRIHRGLAEQRIERSVSDYVLEGARSDQPIIGRLVARGLDDELRGTAYAVIDGIDGRAHHVRLADLDATERWRSGLHRRAAPVQGCGGPRAHCSCGAFRPGARRAGRGDRRHLAGPAALAREPASLSSGGFGHEVREAMDARVEHLTREGLARRQGQRIIFARDLLDTLRRRELDQAAARIASDSALPYPSSEDGEVVSGVYRRALQSRVGPLRHDR